MVHVWSRFDRKKRLSRLRNRRVGQLFGHSWDVKMTMMDKRPKKDYGDVKLTRKRPANAIWVCHHPCKFQRNQCTLTEDFSKFNTRTGLLRDRHFWLLTNSQNKLQTSNHWRRRLTILSGSACLLVWSLTWKWVIATMLLQVQKQSNLIQFAEISS